MSVQVPEAAGAVPEEVLIVDQDEAARKREELKMLYLGFGTGLFIGVLFLTYIVTAAAHIFP